MRENCRRPVTRIYEVGLLIVRAKLIYTCGMRIVGPHNRSEIELDPLVAFRRGRELDAMLRHAAPPIRRGVTRGSHELFNRLDAERQSQAARALNAQ